MSRRGKWRKRRNRARRKKTSFSFIVEIRAKSQEMEAQQSPTNSPRSTKRSRSGSPKTPPRTPRVISRTEPIDHPTTFVQAHTTTFKHVVQMLTGSSETATQASAASASGHPLLSPTTTKNNIPPPIKTGQKKQKLYERRNSIKNVLMISPLNPNGFAQNPIFSPRKQQEILSPSILDFPSLVLSPMTPNQDPFNKSPSSIECLSEEEKAEKAISEKKFYLHPSPRTTPRGSDPPRLLPLFPVTSPRLSGF